MTHSDRTLLPAEVKNQLPIFQLLGDQLPERLKTPEAKKTGAKLLFWAVLIGGGYLFYKMLPSLVKMAEMTLWLAVYSVLTIVLVLLSPKIVAFLHRAGRILIFKADKKMTQRFAIESLEILLQDVASTRIAVKERITQVEGVQISMRNDAESANEEANQKFDQMKRLINKAVAVKTQMEKASLEGMNEKANGYRRELKELENSASLREAEGQSSLEMAKTYTQYGNQFAKALEILKDNESVASLYHSRLQSSITIIRKKMSATDKMKKATDGLADIFQVQDTWRFDVAMEAAKDQIANNVAGIRRNLEFLSENRLNVIGQTKSLDELKVFQQKLESGDIKKLSVTSMTQASYELTDSDKGDKTFSILD